MNIIDDYKKAMARAKAPEGEPRKEVREFAFYSELYNDLLVMCPMVYQPGCLLEREDGAYLILKDSAFLHEAMGPMGLTYIGEV